MLTLTTIWKSLYLLNFRLLIRVKFLMLANEIFLLYCVMLSSQDLT